MQIARVIREQRPRVVILPYWKGRHPDHYTCATLGYEACFLAGLTKLGKSHGFSEPEDLDAIAQLAPRVAVDSRRQKWRGETRIASTRCPRS